MATKSILKSVHLKKKAQVRNLVNALESSFSYEAPEIIYSKKVVTMTKSTMRELFGEK